jgi:uncharacterized protein
VVLLCLSDIHGEGERIRSILSTAGPFDAIVLAGDLTHLGGREEAAEILSPILAAGKPAVAVPGNMDRIGVLAYLEEKGISIHGRALSVGDCGFFGLGGCNPSPFGTPFEVKPAEAKILLRRGYDPIRGMPWKVLVSHAPPKGTKLDRSFAGLHVGSAEVREFLSENQVDLCLCGHIHESSGEDTVDRTHCVNIGPWKSGRYALIPLDKGKIRVDWRSR